MKIAELLKECAAREDRHKEEKKDSFWRGFFLGALLGIVFAAYFSSDPVKVRIPIPFTNSVQTGPTGYPPQREPQKLPIPDPAGRAK